MNIDVKPEKNKQVDIEITIDDFVVNKHLKTAASKISQSVNIPGFRKGKAPYSLIESQYGKDYILENSLDPIIQEVIPTVLDEQKLEYPCAPKVDILEREPKLKINLMVPLMPEVEVGDYKSIKTKVSKERITKKKIDETINRILESVIEIEEFKEISFTITVSLTKFTTKTVSAPNIEDKEEYLKIKDTIIQVKINNKPN